VKIWTKVKVARFFMAHGVYWLWAWVV